MRNTIDTEKIKSYILEKNYSKTSFAKKCKIGYNTLTKILQGNRSVSVIALINVAREMGVSFRDLFLPSDRLAQKQHKRAKSEGKRA